jgi:trk system potassium uptake protein TrkH
VAGSAAALGIMAAIPRLARAPALRAAATVSWLGWVALSIASATHLPAQGLALGLAGIWLALFVWPNPTLRAIDAADASGPRGGWMAVPLAAAIGLGLLATRATASPSPAAALALALVYAWSVHEGSAGPLRAVRTAPVRHMIALGLVGIALLPGLDAGLRLLARAPATGLASAGIAAPCALLAALAIRQAFGRRDAPATASLSSRPIDAVMAQPARAMVASFALLCIVGTLALALPLASSAGRPISPLDAAFTAVSAACVTGLAVLDTPTAFSPFGQAVIAALIQIGGLGIMTFSAAALLLLGSRISLAHERTALDLVGATRRDDLVRAVRAILLVTFVTEAVAGVALSFAFAAGGDPWPMAVWRGFFTAISAYCNAGFALQSDSLIGYAQRPSVLGIIGATIVIGGLGPGVIAWMFLRRQGARAPLHVAVVLWTTALLIVIPTLLLTAFEWEASLAGHTRAHKLSNALFQAITLRTAGFNSVDLTQIAPATWTLMIGLMFVGGSPGSTAGGIKTTTMAIVTLAVVSAIRGRERLELFGRTLPTGLVVRATAVTAVSVASCATALMALQLTQGIAFDRLVFEVVSALATVGLSLGATAELDGVGKAIVMVCMFAGRVGPLSLFVFLQARASGPTRYKLPTESLPIG